MAPDDLIGAYAGKVQRRRIGRQDLARRIDADSRYRQVVERRLLQRGFDCGLPQRDNRGSQIDLLFETLRPRRMPARSLRGLLERFDCATVVACLPV